MGCVTCVGVHATPLDTVSVAWSQSMHVVGTINDSFVVQADWCMCGFSVIGNGVGREREGGGSIMLSLSSPV